MWKPLISVLAALALGASALGSAPAPATAAQTSASVRTITTFDPGAGGAFAESMAGDRHHRLIVSLTEWGVAQGDGWTDNYGQLYRVAPDGTKTTFGPRIDLGPCSQLMGVAVDSAGRVFVAVANFDASCASSLPNGVLRVTAGSARRVLTLPGGVFANGLAVHRGTLYVTDSYGGSIWSGPTARASSPTRAWFTAPALEPTDEIGLGANGITYRRGALYVTGYAKGYVLRVRVGRAGQPAKVRVIARDARLVRADGIAFDAHGLLWVAVNPASDLAAGTQTGDGALIVIAPSGAIHTAATPAHSLDYPTQPIPAGKAVFVANGAFIHGTPSVVEFTHLR